MEFNMRFEKSSGMEGLKK